MFDIPPWAKPSVCPFFLAMRFRWAGPRALQMEKSCYSCLNHLSLFFLPLQCFGSGFTENQCFDFFYQNNLKITRKSIDNMFRFITTKKSKFCRDLILNFFNRIRQNLDMCPDFFNDTKWVTFSLYIQIRKKFTPGSGSVNLKYGSGTLRPVNL